MRTLDSRKQLLLAESELNRNHLMKDLNALTADVRSMTERAKSFASIASSAVVLVGGLMALRRTRSGPAAAKPSRLQTLLKGAGMLSTLWLAFREKRHEQKGK